ncbi:MAG: DUF2118 domain-containing protein [bacterium]
MKYFASIDDREIALEIDDDAGTTVSLNGSSSQSELIAIKDHLLSLKLDGRSYQVFIESNGNHYVVSLNGKKYEVTLDDEKSRLIKSLIKLEDSGHGHAEVKAPMPGLIVKILATEGQRIKKGDSLCIIEAMKMENEIRSNVEGTVTRIHTKEKESVDKDAVLMVIE